MGTKHASKSCVSAFIPILAFILICKIHGQDKVSLQHHNDQQEVPSNWKGDGLSISSKRYKIGGTSIKWHWQQGLEIMIQEPLGLQASFSLKKNVNKRLYSDIGIDQTDHLYRVGGLMCWIYNETPLDDYLLVEFGLGTTKAYQFPFYLNFSGWRACWIRFSEMEQLSIVDALDYMKFKAPKKADSGVLYVDRLQFNGQPIHSRSTPDQQLPFINPKVNGNHWGAQWYWESNYTHDIPL